MLRSAGSSVNSGTNTFTGPQTISDTTDSTSTSTGALIVSGGAGIAKQLWVGSRVNISLGAANTAALVASGHSLTGSNNTTGYSFASTLNTTGATYDVFKIAATVTATGANTNLFAVYGGAAGATKVFAVQTNRINADWISPHSEVSGTIGFGSISATAYQAAIKDGGKIVVRNVGHYSWSNDDNPGNTAADLILSRSAAATLQQGAANAAVPVAQTLQSQGSRAGTDSNVGGGNYTIRSGVGTGTGTLSSLILQSPVAVASGTGAQTQTTGLTIKGGAYIDSVYTVATLPTGAQGMRATVTDSNAASYTAGIGAIVAGGGTTVVPVWHDGTNWRIG